jgi:hypothetical protein
MNLAMGVEGDETRRMPPTPAMYLPHELVESEILVRLPVKSLLRFRCVCKAWGDTISGDASFSEAHVRRYLPHYKRPSSLIAPYLRKIDHDDDMDELTLGMYLREENQRQDGVATLVDDISWFPSADWTEENQLWYTYTTE